MIGYPSGQDGAILPARNTGFVPLVHRSCFGVLSHIINPLLTKLSRSINTQKKRTRPKSSHLDLTLTNRTSLLQYVPGYSSPIFSQHFSLTDRRKRETVYLGMFKAKILVLGPCEVNFSRGKPYLTTPVLLILIGCLFFISSCESL